MDCMLDAVARAEWSLEQAVEMQFETDTGIAQ